MQINKCKISLYTSRNNAPRLQLEASRQFHGVLKYQLGQRLADWLRLQRRAEPLTLESLHLDLGTLVIGEFSAQFAPRVMAALDQALRNLRLPAEHSERVIDSDDGEQSLTFRQSAVAAPAVAVTDPLQRFQRYLQTGYWSPPQAEQENAPAQQDQDPTPTAWLEYYLHQALHRGIAPWTGLIACLAEPQARRRLLSCLTVTVWPLWQQFMLDLPAPAIDDSVKADAIGLLLLLWRRQTLSAETELPLIERFYSQELHQPQEKQRAELERLLDRAGRTGQLSMLKHWLRQLLVQHGETLWPSFTPSAQQRLIQALPEISSLLPNMPPAPANPRQPMPGSKDAADRLVPGSSDIQHRRVGNSRPPMPGSKDAADRLVPDSSDIQHRRVGNSRQLTREHFPAAGEALVVHHAGLVLLWPLLPRWFAGLGLAAKASELTPLAFVSPQAQIDAIALLDALIWQDEHGGEWRSLFSKLLCGWPLNAPIEQWPSEERIAELREMVEAPWQAVLQQLQQMQLLQRQPRPGLDKLTVRDFCQLFLQRSGTLKEAGIGWQLTVEPHPADLLLWAIPWPLEQMIYPWMTGPVTIDWKMPVFPHTV